MSKRLKGYMTSLPIHGSRFPHRVQNILLRDYCTRFGFDYQFSAIEGSVQDSFLVLMDMIRNDESYDGILFFSLYMLPKDRKTRSSVYSILQKDKTLHFCLEQLSIQEKKDIGIMEDILQVRQTLAHVPLQGKYQYKEQMSSEFLHFLNLKPDSY